jgi:GTPase SAR1 family protein
MSERFTVTVLGPSAEGKSAYIHFLTKRVNLKKHVPTTEVCETEFKVNREEGNCVVRIFDTPAVLEDESILDDVISKSDGFLIVFSKNVERSTQEQEISKYLKIITKKDFKTNPTVFLVASHDDLDSLILDCDDVEDIGLKFGLKFFEISSKTGNQIEQSFESLIKKLYKRKEKGKKRISQRLVYALELPQEEGEDTEVMTSPKGVHSNQVINFESHDEKVEPEVVDKKENRKSAKLIGAFGKKKEEEEEVSQEDKRKSLQKTLSQMYSVENMTSPREFATTQETTEKTMEKRKSAQILSNLFTKKEQNEISDTSKQESKTESKTEKRKSLSSKLSSFFKK